MLSKGKSYKGSSGTKTLKLFLLKDIMDFYAESKFDFLKLKVFSIQFLNDHLIQFGTYEITKATFKQKLVKAIQLKNNFYSLASNDDDFFDCLSSFLQARIETS